MSFIERRKKANGDEVIEVNLLVTRLYINVNSVTAPVDTVPEARRYFVPEEFWSQCKLRARANVNRRPRRGTK